MSIALSFINSTYTTSNKPSVDTLKSDLSLIETDLNAHEAGTSVHGVTGTVVGTTEIQTLTNKTLTSPVISQIELGNSTDTTITRVSAGVAAIEGNNIITTATVGTVIQVANVLNVTKSTGTTVIPADDTIPQITEGDEYMTLDITPTSATSKLLIQVVVNCACSSATNVSIALFKDATAGALNASSFYHTTANGGGCYALNHYMTAGTTSAMTFRVRAGGALGTLTVNGNSGNRLLGGVLTSSITITEIK